MVYWIIGGIAAIVMIGLIIVLRRRSTGTLTSIVLLRSSPATISEEKIRAAAKAVFQEAGGVTVLPSEGLPPGLAGGFAVTVNGAPMFYVINAHRTYTSDMERTVSAIKDSRAQAVFSSHQAWVSVDVVGGAPPQDQRAFVHLAMATIATRLMDAQTLLLFSTWRSKFAWPTDMKKAADPVGLDGVFGID